MLIFNISFSRLWLLRLLFNLYYLIYFLLSDLFPLHLFCFTVLTTFSHEFITINSFNFRLTVFLSEDFSKRTLILSFFTFKSLMLFSKGRCDYFANRFVRIFPNVIFFTSRNNNFYFLPIGLNFSLINVNTTNRLSYDPLQLDQLVRS